MDAMVGREVFVTIGVEVGATVVWVGWRVKLATAVALGRTNSVGGSSVGSSVGITAWIVSVTGTLVDKFPSAVASVNPPKITVMDIAASRMPIPICRKDSIDQTPSGSSVGATALNGSETLNVEPDPISVSTHIRPF